jgi:hypothetical protein
MLLSPIVDAVLVGAPLERQLFTVLDERECESWILETYEQRLGTYHARKAREKAIDDIIEDKFTVAYPDGTVVVQAPVIENTVVSGIEDTFKLGSEAFPTLKVEAPTETGVIKAKQRQQVISYYWQESRLRVLLPSLYRDLAAQGLAAIRVQPDWNLPVEERFPKFERLNPRGVIPPPNWQHPSEPDDVMCTEVVKARYFKEQFPLAWARLTETQDKPPLNADVEIVYYYSARMVAAAARMAGRSAAMYAMDNSIKCNPVILIGRDSADGQIRGQFEKMIAPMLLTNRLATQAAAYGDQLVYAVPWKKKVQGNLHYGPKEFWDLGEDGEVGRLGPPSVDPSFWRLLGETQRWSRNAGHVPESREGQIQNFGSASYLKAAQGALTTIVSHLQTAMADGIERASKVAQAVDLAYCNESKSIIGLGQGGQFRLTYKPSELFSGKNYSCIVSYGTGSGLDSFNKIITIIQLLGSGLVSKRWAMENIPGIDNPLQMEGQMLDEALLQMLTQVGLSKAAQGDDTALRALVEAKDSKQNLLLVARDILSGTEPAMPEVQPVNAAQQANSLQKGGIPGNAPLAPAPNSPLPPLTQIMVR